MNSAAATLTGASLPADDAVGDAAARGAATRGALRGEQRGAPAADGRAPRATAQRSATDAPAGDVAAGVDEVRAALARLRADASRVVEVESLRLRARVDRRLSRWLGAALLALLGAAALVTGGVLLARGLSGALGALVGGPEWVGPLLAGVTLPLTALLVVRLLRARRARARLRRAEELAAS